jgi:hypothetical protein
MYVTLNLVVKKTKIKFIHIKPSTYFFNWYTVNCRIIPTLSSQRLPYINRKNLVKLL